MSKKTGIRQVLVFENRDTSGMLLAAKLRKFVGPTSFQVTTASDLPTVKQILKIEAVAAVIIEVGKEAGDAMTVLRILEGFPSIPVFIFNGFLLPRIAEKSLEYNHEQYCEDYKNLDRFIAKILSELISKRRGIIHGIALGNFLQLMNSEKFSGQIIVTTGNKKGVLFLLGGQLVSASMNGSPSNTSLAEISSWEKVTVEIKEEQHTDKTDSGHSQKADLLAEKELDTADLNHEAGIRPIDILCFTHQGKKITIDIKKLHTELLEIQDLLTDTLLRMDIFLSANGRSLAGWNSHPLTLSTFAAITASVMESLAKSGFPHLQNYYLFDLDSEHTVLVIIKEELQWGMLLRGGKEHVDLLLKNIIPKAIKALCGSLQNTHTVEEAPRESWAKTETSF